MIFKGKDLKRALQIFNLTQQEAADRLGVSRQTLSTYLRSAELPDELLHNVKEKLGIDLGFISRELSNLFVTKDGDITDPDNQADTTKRPLDANDIVTPKGKITSRKQNLIKSNALIPFYNLDFMAGNAVEFYQDATIYPDYYMDVPEFYGCTAFRAYSDSMEDKIRSGNILFATKLEDWRSHLEYGQIYGITCKDGRRYLKYIRVNTTDRTQFLLKSQNPNYDDFTLPISKINNLWLIQGWLDRRT